MVNSSLYNLLYKYESGGSKIKKTFSNFSTLLNNKKQFLIMILANLITQLGITYYVMTKTKVTEEDNKFSKQFVLIIISFIIIYILAVVPIPSWLKIIVFSVFSYIQGILLASVKLSINDDNLINMAMLGSIGLFIVLFLIGIFLLATGIKLGIKTGFILLVSLIILIIFHVFSLFQKSRLLTKTLSAIGIIIFSFYIIYDTNLILQRDYYGDFITASIDYYLDILNIFVKIVKLNDN